SKSGVTAPMQVEPFYILRANWKKVAVAMQFDALLQDHATGLYNTLLTSPYPRANRPEGVTFRHTAIA
ncbi:MAG: hypothetical protein V3T31_07845, partial [candidate division Zixibacteria bacterium]